MLPLKGYRQVFVISYENYLCSLCPCSDKEVELRLVVSQLEQDRQVVSNKVRRLQSELESLGTERDVAVKVAVELKAKFKALKESSKKDMSNLQSRLHQVSISLELLYRHVHVCTLK